MAGDSFSKGLGKGFLGGLVGGASGFVLGGLSGGWDAVRHHRDFYSGDILSVQEKLDVLLGVNMPDLESSLNMRMRSEYSHKMKPIIGKAEKIYQAIRGVYHLYRDH